jgi:hypothetical protein
MHGSLTQCLRRLEWLAQRGAGVFVAINRTDLRGCRIENIVAPRALLADIDAAPLKNLLPLAEVGLVPHLIVRTSPGRHQGFCLVEAGLPLDAMPGLVRRFATIVGCDPHVCNLNRVMRLPGSLHQKNPARPYRVRIVAELRQPPYSLRQIEAALRAVERNGKTKLAPERATAADLPIAIENPKMPEPWTTGEEARLRSALMALDPREGNATWQPVTFALHWLSGGVGWETIAKAIWQEWSSGRLHGLLVPPLNYTDAENRSRWASLDSKKGRQLITIGTVYAMAKARGWHEPVVDIVPAVEPIIEVRQPIEVVVETRRRTTRA